MGLGRPPRREAGPPLELTGKADVRGEQARPPPGPPGGRPDVGALSPLAPPTDLPSEQETYSPGDTGGQGHAHDRRGQYVDPMTRLEAPVLHEHGRSVRLQSGIA